MTIIPCPTLKVKRNIDILKTKSLNYVFHYVHQRCRFDFGSMKRVKSENKVMRIGVICRNTGRINNNEIQTVAIVYALRQVGVTVISMLKFIIKWSARNKPGVGKFGWAYRPRGRRHGCIEQLLGTQPRMRWFSSKTMIHQS